MKPVLILLAVVGILGLLFGLSQRNQDPAFPKLVAALGTEDPEERSEVILSLNSDPKFLEDSQVVRALFTNLLETNEAARSAAELVVQKNKQILIPKIKPYLVDANDPNYLLGLIAVRNIGRPCAEYTDVIIQRLVKSFALSDYDTFIKFFEESDDDDENAGKPPLSPEAAEFDRVRQGQFKLRLASLWALEEIGIPSEPHSQLMIEIMQKRYPPGAEFNLTCGAIRVLARMEPRPVSAIPALMEAAAGPNVSVRSQSVRALGVIGPGAPQQAAILELLNRKLETVLQPDKLVALEALENFGREAQASAPKIRELMMDSSKSVMPQAAVTFYRITGEAEPMTEVLRSTLQQMTYKSATISLIGTLGAAAKPLLPDLIAELDSEDEFIRETAVLALEKLGSLAQPAVEKLQKIAEDDPDPIVREHAKQALNKIAI